MIYGINFGREPIPTDIRARFPERTRIVDGLIESKKVFGHLVGVCDKPTDVIRMTSQATNGTRRLQWLERKFAGITCYDVYAY